MQVHPSGSSELSETALQGVLDGERFAQRSFVLLYQDRVFRLLRRMLEPSGLADSVEDLGQEVFLRAFAGLTAFDPRGPAKLSTWVLTIATRLALNALRDARRVRGNPRGPRSVRAPDNQSLRLALERAVGSLSPSLRAAFVLREYYGFDYAEIGAALELPEGTVASRIARARATLREQLGGDER